MSTLPDRALREALEHLTATPAPTDLARTAIGRAHRRRLVRRAGLVAGVAAFVPALAVAILAVPGARTAPTDPGAVRPGGRVVIAYTGIDPDGGRTDPGPANDISLLLNFDTGAYESVPYNDVVPSPDRRLAVVRQGDNSAAHPTRVGVLDLATDQVRWLPDTAPRGYEETPTWSPDSRTFVLVEVPRDADGHGLRLVDADTLAETFVRLSGLGERMALGPNVRWSADGTELIVVLSESTGTTTEITGIRRFAPDGAELRTVPVDRLPTEGTSVSPDGRRLLLWGAPGATATLIDTDTGAASAVPQRGILVGWYDATHYIAAPAPRRGDPIRQWEIVGISGTVVRTVAPPPGAPGLTQGIVIGSADGLSAAGEKYVI